MNEAIKALCDLGPELKRLQRMGALEDDYFGGVVDGQRCIRAAQLETILAAIEALKNQGARPSWRSS